MVWSHHGGTHNQLLMQAAEYGLFGIGMWVWLLLILWRGRFFSEPGLQLAMVFLFASMSMFTHLMLDVESFWLATFALVSTRMPWNPPDRARRTARPSARVRTARHVGSADDQNQAPLDGTRS
jgi:hypothetical protein